MKILVTFSFLFLFHTVYRGEIMNDLNPILYTIRPGDTLYNLAIQYGTTVQDLMDTNLALDPYNLRVGQQIYIYPSYNDFSNDYWVSRFRTNKSSFT